MRLWRHALLVAVVAAAFLADGARAVEVEIEVRATLVEDDSGKLRVQIDKAYHDTAFVHSGDQITWVCECPPGTEFAVEDLSFIADLEEAAEMLIRVHGRGVERLRRELESVQLLSAERGGRQGRPGVWKETAAHALLLIKDLEATLTAAPRKLFENWSPPGFVDRASPIQSAPVVKDVGHGLFKFSWRVRLKGDPTSEDVWDPHICTSTSCDS